MKKRLAVFDLDGTLNRTELFSVPAHMRALAERGIHDVTPQMVIDTFGERAEDYVKKLMGPSSPEEARRYLDDVAKYERELIWENGRAYDGVAEGLKRLQEDGVITAICSNSSSRYINMVLNALHLSELIDEIQDLRPGMTKVETLHLLLDRVNPDAAVMVGDRSFDIEAGKKNGLKTIGCAYGFQPNEAAQADVVIESGAEIYHAAVTLLEGSV